MTDAERVTEGPPPFPKARRREPRRRRLLQSLFRVPELEARDDGRVGRRNGAEESVRGRGGRRREEREEEETERDEWFHHRHRHYVRKEFTNKKTAFFVSQRLDDEILTCFFLQLIEKRTKNAWNDSRKASVFVFLLLSRNFNREKNDDVESLFSIFISL